MSEGKCDLFNLPAQMDDGDNDGRDDILCVLLVKLRSGL